MYRLGVFVVLMVLMVLINIYIRCSKIRQEKGARSGGPSQTVGGKRTRAMQRTRSASPHNVKLKNIVSASQSSHRSGPRLLDVTQTHTLAHSSTTCPAGQHSRHGNGHGMLCSALLCIASDRLYDVAFAAQPSLLLPPSNTTKAALRAMSPKMEMPMSASDCRPP